MWQKYGFDEPNYNVNNDLNAKYTNISNSDFFTNLNNLVANIFSDINEIITEKYNIVGFAFKTNNLTVFISQIQDYIINVPGNKINYRVSYTDDGTIIYIYFDDTSSRYIKANILNILNFINSVAFYIKDYDIYRDGKCDKDLVPITALHKDMFSESAWSKIIKMKEVKNKEDEVIHIFNFDLYRIFDAINKKDMA